MKITSFDSQNSNNKIVRDIKQKNLFNLFQKNIIYNSDIKFDIYIVPREFEMRLDRISNYLYGTTDYIEELMVINNIINPYSIKEGQYIYFCDPALLNSLYTNDEMNTDIIEKKKKLIESKKNNKKSNFTSPTIKPDNLNQIKISKDNRVQFINSFE